MVMKDYVVIRSIIIDPERHLYEWTIIRKVDSPGQALVQSGFGPANHLDTVSVIEMVSDTYPHQFDVLPPIDNMEWRQR